MSPKEHFCEIILKSFSWSRRRCHLKVFLLLALAVILFRGTILATLEEGYPKNYSILFYPISLEGRRGTTDEFATIPLHFVLFAAALVELAKFIPVHSLKHDQTSYFPFLDQGQEFIIFSNSCLDFSANLLIGHMVLE